MAGGNPVKQRSNTWKPGQSGNPNGRPRKMTPDGKSVAEIARAYTADAIAALAKIATDGESEAAIVSACSALLDRGWGKPTQPISGDDDKPPIAFVAWPIPAHPLETKA